jgi:hypothetical protein
MFSEFQNPNKTKLINKIVNQLMKNKYSHERRIDFEKCKKMGLIVELIEEDTEIEDIFIDILYAYSITIKIKRISKIIDTADGESNYYDEGCWKADI